jgi:predicted aspartyl protease
LKKCFKFTKENSSSLGIVYRPIVKVGLRDANGEPFELGVLVDSGADISIFSRRIGDIMGINVEKGEEKIFRGIVGELIAYVHKIPISINGREVETRVAFALSEVPNLLGRLDIFKNFEISFRKEDDLCFSD